MNLFQIYSDPETLPGYQHRNLLPWRAYDLALRVKKKLTPAQLANIAQDPVWAYAYAHNVLGGPWPQGEPVIAQDPQWAYWYALFVLKRPWAAGEPAIAQDPYWAKCYAQDVIGGRWPQGEAAMLKDPRVWRSYQAWLLKGSDQGALL